MIVPEALFGQRRIASLTKAEQMWQKEKPPPIHLPNMRQKLDLDPGFAQKKKKYRTGIKQSAGLKI